MVCNRDAFNILRYSDDGLGFKLSVLQTHWSKLNGLSYRSCVTADLSSWEFWVSRFCSVLRCWISLMYWPVLLLRSSRSSYVSQRFTGHLLKLNLPLLLCIKVWCHYIITIFIFLNVMQVLSWPIWCGEVYKMAAICHPSRTGPPQGPGLIWEPPLIRTKTSLRENKTHHDVR